MWVRDLHRNNSFIWETGSFVLDKCCSQYLQCWPGKDIFSELAQWDICRAHNLYWVITERRIHRCCCSLSRIISQSCCNWDQNKWQRWEWSTSVTMVMGVCRNGGELRARKNALLVLWNASYFTVDIFCFHEPSTLWHPFSSITGCFWQRLCSSSVQCICSPLKSLTFKETALTNAAKWRHVSSFLCKRKLSDKPSLH